MKLLFLLFVLAASAVQANDNSPWSRIILAGSPYLLVGFVPPDLKQADTLNIFIEGDGKPGIALSLAEKIGGNSVYLGRPCQYPIGSRYSTCSKAVWTTGRYSRQVIEVMNHAITVMKVRYHAKHLRLIGFSGGGAIASIIATERPDMSLLVTVAGNLDVKRWTDYNEIKPLSDSLNPADFAAQLAKVPQVHLIGDRDTVVPGSVLTSYLAHMKDLNRVQSYIVAGANHTCCWSIALANVLH